MLSNEEKSTLSAELQVDIDSINEVLEVLESYTDDSEAVKNTLRVKFGAEGVSVFDLDYVGTMQGHFLINAGLDTIEKISNKSTNELVEVKYITHDKAASILDDAAALKGVDGADHSPIIVGQSKEKNDDIPLEEATIEYEKANNDSAQPFLAGEDLIEATPRIDRSDDYPGTCCFVFDSNAWSEQNDEFRSLELEAFDDKVWRCPHNAPDDHSYCIFHRQIEKKDNQSVMAELEEAITQPVDEQVKKQFFGARFEDLDLSHCSVNSGDQFDIDLRHISVRREADFTNVTVSNNINLGYSKFKGGLSLEDATFEGEFKLYQCYVAAPMNGNNLYCQGKANFAHSTFENGVQLHWSDFDDTVTFTRACFEGYLRSHDTTFSGPVYFFDSEFQYDVSLEGSRFSTKAVFSGAEFYLNDQRNYKPEFSDVRFDGEVIFTRREEDDEPAEFNQEPNFTDAIFNESVTFQGVFLGDGIDLSQAVFYKDANFDDVDLNSEFLGEGCQIDGELVFTPNSIDDETCYVNLKHSQLQNGTLSHPANGYCYFDCASATLGNIDVLPPNDDRYALDFVRMFRTEFDGFDFMPHRIGLEEEDYEIHTFEGTPPVEIEKISPEDRELTYLRAKSGANESGDSRSASGFFIQEMRARRKRFDSKNFDNGRRAGLYNWYRKWANWAFDEICRYGEGPWRTVGMMGLTIILFGIIYAVLFWGVTTRTPYPQMEYHLIAESMLFSAESFTSLVHSPSAEVTSLWIRGMSVFQGFSGALFIALFLFTLTRSIHR